MTPLASDGFVLNLIDTLLILCKPFVGNFQKYGTFLNKINCFYITNNDQIDRADKIEKIDSSDVSDLILLGAPGSLSGVTLNPFVETSSLLGDGG
jgi:hypothetical protein